MKNKSDLILRSALAATVASLLCLAGNAGAQSPTPEDTAASAETSKAAKTTKSEKTTSSKTQSASESTKASAGQLASKDRDFMMTAAKGGMMEVHMGQMAEKQGQSAEVKKLGKQMVADHTKANNQLMSLAATKGVKLDTRHKMDKISGDRFDEQWLTQMVSDHQKTITAFETEAKSGSDAEVKSWASKTLPTLKKHLKMVQDAQGKMKKAS